MRFLSLLLLIFIVLPASGQNPDSVHTGLFNLYENASDQEGMFYLPEAFRPGIAAAPKLINERNLQAAVAAKNFRLSAGIAAALAWQELDAGNAGKAQNFLTIAANARMQMKDYAGHVAALLQSGYIHYRNLDYDAAQKQFSAGLKEAEEKNLTKIIPVAHALVAQSFLVQKDFETADKHYKQAYDAFNEAGNKKAKARIGIQLAEISIRKSEHSKALKILDECFSYFSSIDDRSGQALVLRDKGIIAFKEAHYEDAISFFQQSNNLSGQLSVAKLLKETYFRLFNIKSLAGEFEASNNMNIKYVQIRDSIDQVEKSRVMNSQMTRRDLLEHETIEEMRRNEVISYQQLSAQELEMNRQLTTTEIERLEKEKIIEDLNAAKRLSDQANIEREEKIQLLTRQKSLQDLALSKKELEMSREETFRNTLITAFVFIIIIAGLLYNRYRNQRKSHEKLDRAYTELSETHSKLLSAQEQLVHAQKMASLGQLTAGIAHEIQNPLNFVNNFAELSIELIDEIKSGKDETGEVINDLRANLQKINTHGKRADKIVKGMLIHSRAGQAEKQPADINRMIDELLDLSYHGNKSRDNNFTSEIIKNLDVKIPEVNIVTQDISRVLINLFNNSFYAVGQRSKIEGRNFRGSVGVSTFRENNHVVISIKDNGTGIPEDIKKKIFDPFFTTKPAGEGTGLGLSLSYDIIVKGHHGSLNVSSEKDKFTEFTITLPLN